MKLREIPAYQSKYLKAADLRGRSVKATISAITLEEFMNRTTKAREKSAVIWFEGKNKGLVINKTRLIQLEEIFSTDDTDRYLGHQVCLNPTRYNGKDTIFISQVPQEEPRNG